MKEHIISGDYVDIKLSEDNNLFSCKVLQTPDVPGEYWRLREIEGTIIYVHKFEYMRLVPVLNKVVK